MQRICVFGDKATYRLYAGHLRSACFVRRLDISWLSPAVRHIANGVAKCQNKSIRFPDVSRISLSLSLLLRISLFSRRQFDQVSFLFFLFPFEYRREI